MHLRCGDMLTCLQSRVCDCLDTLSYHVLLSPRVGAWFGHVIRVFFRSCWLVQLSHIMEARLAMCLVTCLVRCSLYSDMLRQVFCDVGSGSSHVDDVLKHIFCHLFDQVTCSGTSVMRSGHCLVSFWEALLHTFDMFWMCFSHLATCSVTYFWSAWRSVCPCDWTHLAPSLIM